jgi:hypothetical protein
MIERRITTYAGWVEGASLPREMRIQFGVGDGFLVVRESWYYSLTGLVAEGLCDGSARLPGNKVKRM